MAWTYLKFLTTILLLGVSFVGVVKPFFRSHTGSVSEVGKAKPWPSHFMGDPLIRIPLTAAEAGFYKDFPGDAAQFSTASERIIIRRVNLATRKLHPATDCFKGMGYSIEEAGLKMDPSERIWRSFRATKKEENLEVLELISDGHGNNWSDVSAWYWAALMKRTAGPWLSYVRIRILNT